MTPARSYKERIDRARRFAIWAHGDQCYGEVFPYVFHLDAVASVAMAIEAPSEVHEAAYLHDVVEDTDVPLPVIHDLFGQQVAELVAAVTNEPGANRAERHARTYPKTRAAGPVAVCLKLCDRIANIRACSVPGPAKLLQMYLKERAGFRAALFREGENTPAWTLLDKTEASVLP